MHERVKGHTVIWVEGDKQTLVIELRQRLAGDNINSSLLAFAIRGEAAGTQSKADLAKINKKQTNVLVCE